MSSITVKLFILAFAALLTSSIAQEVIRCGVGSATIEQMAIAANLSRLENIQARSDIPDHITIPTWFHILSTGETTELGNIPDEMVYEQMRVLNEDYGPHNISFDLQGITRTVNAAWASDQNGTAMRTELRRGGYDTLNIYSMNALRPLGYCSFPELDAIPGSDVFIQDGCVVSSTSLPGGRPPYDLGRTTTHEVGHWMNLFHTFENGCSCVGDMIHDTPAEALPHFGCPIGLDSCPDRPGLDPIHNFMAYTTDICMEEFTAGQAFRMRAAWYNIRRPQAS